ncbi:hypothetical protein BDR06DRAFT_874060, partial [Suillus hirtellus]
KERKTVKKLKTKENTDSFALSLREVNIIPGAQLNLNVPEGKTFNLCTHQRPLTPEQSHFYNEQVEEMLKAGIIDQVPPELVKCTAMTVIAQKAHEMNGLSEEELKQRVNDQC